MKLPLLDATVDLVLLLGFALPHSLLLRASGRRLLSRLVPRSMFYSAYGLVSALTLLAVYASWRPLPGIVWEVGGDAGRALLAGHAAAWALMAVSLFHYGAVRQPGIAHWWEHIRGRREPAYRVPRTGPFRLTRHPIYIAMFLMLWITPWMTTGHLLVSVVWTAYLVGGVIHKDRRLTRTLGDAWTRAARRPLRITAPAAAPVAA